MSVLTLHAKHSALAEAVELGKHGMFVAALAQLQSVGSLRDWSGPARTEVAWLVAELGAPRLSRWHLLKAWREAPESLMVRNAYAQVLDDLRGPLDTLEFLEHAVQPTADDEPEERLRWLWIKSSVLIQLRDFWAAEEYIDQMA